MGVNQSFEKLEDFIWATKSSKLKTIFFNLIQNTTDVKLKQGDNLFDGQRITSFVTLNSISDDGKLYIAHQAEVAKILIAPSTTQEEINAFLQTAKDKLNNDYIKVIQDKYDSVELRAGSCGPTVA